jgi:ubiquinone/menaquinone biosynthesis C-methylase UbiE
MERARTGQVTHSVADVYEGFFVPALFQQWALRITRALQLTPGQTVLDIACGTGASPKRPPNGSAQTGM